MVDIDERSNTVSWSVAVSLLFAFNVLPQVGTKAAYGHLSEFKAVPVGLLAIPFPSILLAIEAWNPTSGTCATIILDAFPEGCNGWILETERDSGASGACQIGFMLSRTHGMSVIHVLLAITPAEAVSLKFLALGTHSPSRALITRAVEC
ncbi:hypothetical protein ARMSODRAFT_352277 [Armillaria solidipes]|uniref:Uncharacterized protein n=1 Tax=Armillaria solidipes TaxID=1076256 RepID=A0A2H3BHW8_9AGAR|nr:hypothetical protein ARMSODRAFT_352277 [Armillaria solidipes]